MTTAQIAATALTGTGTGWAALSGVSAALAVSP